jgi:transglutaminase-like putative cysteine protease
VKYAVTHLTEYRYGEPVPLGHNSVRLKPRKMDRQDLLSHSLEVTPNPIVRNERIDFFGNPVTWFSVQEPHDRLRIISRSTIEVRPLQLPTGFWWPAWDHVAFKLQGRDLQLLEAKQFVFDSPHVATDKLLADYARPSFEAGRPLLDCVTELTDRIYHEFTFDTDMTTVGTPILEVLQHRHGVCQDFAHLQIGCLRSLGLAARYVSGYLNTAPPGDQHRLVGADASHAWVSVFFPEYGWIDFDPTNGLLPSDGHVAVGWARDYGDISPVRGVVVGGRRHWLNVSVDVEPVPAKN